NAFKLYSIDYKGAYPVIKFNLPGSPVLQTINGVGITALYWQDFLVPYISKAANINQGNTGSNGNFGAAQKSLFWACPEWTGRLNAFSGYQAANGQSVYETGYSMNIY